MGKENVVGCKQFFLSSFVLFAFINSLGFCIQLKRLGEAYQVVGFMVLVTRRGKRVVVTAGGSHLGQQYIDMTELEEDNSGPVQDFCKFVNGQRVVKKLTGSEITALTKPRKERKGRVILADGKYDKGETFIDFSLIFNETFIDFSLIFNMTD
jgi:hypothetical protein